MFLFISFFNVLCVKEIYCQAICLSNCCLIALNYLFVYATLRLLLFNVNPCMNVYKRAKFCSKVKRFEITIFNYIKSADHL